MAIPSNRLTAVTLPSLLTSALGLGMQNAALARYSGFGENAAPGALPLTGQVPAVDGVRPVEYEQVGWASQFFGAGATWHRYAWHGVAGGRTTYLEVVSSRDLGSFSVYGLEACYRFHGYRVSGVNDAEVGAPARARVIRYADVASRRGWTVVSWITPVRGAGGRRFERAVLLLPSRPDGGRDQSYAVALRLARQVVHGRSRTARA